MRDVVEEARDHDAGAFDGPAKYAAYLAGLCQDLADEIERLRGLLREAIDADRDHYATAMAVLMAGCWHKRVREALGKQDV